MFSAIAPFICEKTTVATKTLALLASASLASAGLYGASATRAADVLPGAYNTFMAEEVGGAPSGPKCRVDVVRSGEAGVANVTRSALSDGQCVCTVTTGPEAGNGAAEQVVSALLRDKTCDGAPPPAEAGQGFGPAAGLLGGLVGAGAVGGAAAGVGNDSNG